GRLLTRVVAQHEPFADECAERCGIPPICTIAVCVHILDVHGLHRCAAMMGSIGSQCRDARQTGRSFCTSATDPDTLRTKRRYSAASAALTPRWAPADPAPLHRPEGRAVPSRRARPRLPAAA